MRRTKPQHPGYQNTIEFKCDYCGIPAYDKPSSYKRKERHFCSTECYSLFRKHLLPKEEQHRFGTGHSMEERRLRRNARTILNHHLRDNGIERPRCELCTEVAEAHHDDYSKPLEVKWLCLKHHRLYHKIGIEIYKNPDLLATSNHQQP